MQETELLPYGHPRAKDYLPGAEVLVREKTDSANENGETNEGEDEGEYRNKLSPNFLMSINPLIIGTLQNVSIPAA